MTNFPTLPRRQFIAASAALGLSTALPASAALISDLDHITKARVLGSVDAPVRLTEFYSMTCGHCAAFHTGTFPLLKERLIDTGKVALEMAPFPLDGLALRAHALARALPANRYFAMVKTLLEQQSEWVRAPDPLQALIKYGRLAGVSEADFNQLMRNRPLLEALVGMAQSAQEKWQINSTPSFVINDKKVLSGNMRYEKLLSELGAFGI
jgi:protein-disulfide isomerase